METIAEKETDCYYYEAVKYIDNSIRYYRLEPSENMSDKNMDGALVKHRISKNEWDKLNEK